VRGPRASGGARGRGSRGGQSSSRTSGTSSSNGRQRQQQQQQHGQLQLDPQTVQQVMAITGASQPAAEEALRQAGGDLMHAIIAAEHSRS
jgi:NACalpha-BTF3-like transcription factor